MSGLSWPSKDWANEQLKFAIAVLDGKIVKSLPPGRIQIALLIRDRLRAEGFWWQAKTLEFHLHRFQGRQRQVVVGLRRIRR